MLCFIIFLMKNVLSFKYTLYMSVANLKPKIVSLLWFNLQHIRIQLAGVWRRCALSRSLGGGQRRSTVCGVNHCSSRESNHDPSIIQPLVHVFTPSLYQNFTFIFSHFRYLSSSKLQEQISQDGTLLLTVLQLYYLRKSCTFFKCQISYVIYGP